MEQKDVIIIGGGVVGCATARALSAYALDVLLLEQAEDVCSGTSKANSAIVHAGFDAKPGTNKAKFNIEGMRMMEALTKELEVSYKRCGALVISFSEEDNPQVQALYDRGIENGLAAEEMEVLSGDQARELEPALTAEVTGALYAKTSAIICPFELTTALAENAAHNGVEFRFLSRVENIKKKEGGFVVTTSDGTSFETRMIVNAAGVESDRIHNMVSENKLSITARKGDYLLMDKEVGNTVSRTIFQLPGKYGKGVLVTPTVHGNLLAGPTADDVEDKENTATTADALADVRDKASKSVANMPFRQVITSFSGLRAHEKGGDFVIGPCTDAPRFYDAAGIESPGLSAAPAIGVFLAEAIAKEAGAEKKPGFDGRRKRIPRVSEATKEELQALIEKDPAYGQIVCRCETVSEGEIREAIRRTPGAKSLDGVKRRVRAGMGRCQAGFCTPRVMEILSEELGIPMEQICKNRPGSELLVADVRENAASGGKEVR